jgi:hypothetical protein
MLSGISLLVLVAGCQPTLPPVLADGAPKAEAYEVVVVDADRADLVEAGLDRADIVTRFDDGGRVAYVVPADAAAELSSFDSVPLDHVTMTIRLARLGDDGDGIFVNAEVFERGVEVHFTGPDVKRAFAELHALETNAWQKVETDLPAMFAQMSDPAPSYMFEQGFQVKLDVVVRGGNPTDRETQAVLYELHRTSGYHRTWRAE